MNQSISIRQFVLRAFGMALVVPVVAYTGFLAWDVVVKIWKIGWDSQPSTFISRFGIQTYVGYTVIVAAALMWMAYFFREKLVGYLAIVACVMLALFALGFITSRLGVL